MWFLGPFLIVYVMIRFWRLTLTLATVGLTWYLIVQHPLVGYVLLVLEVAIVIGVLQIREQDDNAREAINLQRRVESDLDRRDRHLEADRVGRAQVELQADLIAQALIREARRVR
jgi:cobalamin biosynthesis protein CobD/CbiB